MKTLILGLGNPILCDDGVGICVAGELRRRLNRKDITVKETSLAGLRLLDLLAGYDKAVIIDAIVTDGGKAGQIYRLGPDAFDDARHLSCIHDVDFATALDLGRRLGMVLPQQIVVYAIEAGDTSTFGEECTPEVRQAIPLCVDMVLQELDADSKV